MCPQANPDALKIQNENLARFKAHLVKHKKNIKPDANCGTIYAGNYAPRALDLNKEMKRYVGKSEVKVVARELMPLHKLIATINKIEIRKEGKLKFDTLVDVLGDMPAPKMMCPDEKVEVRCKSFAEFAFIAGDMRRDSGIEHTLLPYKVSKEVWKFLSKIYIENAEGDLKILEGVLKKHDDLDATKTMINTEIAKAMNSRKLSMETRKKAANLVEKYLDKLPGKKSKLAKDLESFRANLAKHVKTSQKPVKP